MNSFKILPSISWYTHPNSGNRVQGKFISKTISAYYHSEYYGGDSERRGTEGTVENIITTLKNQFGKTDINTLQNAATNLIKILEADLFALYLESGHNSFTVCVVPRAKALSNYTKKQLVFRNTVGLVADSMEDFSNGVDYIERHTDTRTTHLDKSGYGGEGALPYPGITMKTCSISAEVKNKDIILIDDLYTESVNIDEDVIQALLDSGANSVLFYSIGKTVRKV